MSLRKFLFAFFLVTSAVANAQQTTKHYNILWVAYNSTFHLNNKWLLVGDAEVRTVDWADKWLLCAVRTGVGYSVAPNLSLAAGGALFRTAQYNKNNYFFKNEWRLWQEAAYTLKFKNRTNLFQRLRTEQRFLQQTVNNKKVNKYQYIFRLRYRFEWTFPLVEDKIRLLAGDEIFVNPGHINSQLFFDQNRTFGGLNFKISNATILQTQYIKIFQWRNPTSVLEDQNVIRINFVQQFSNKIKKSNS
ncbi:MAG: DUF2490 domain-containing protein [Bacteroidota bacterium]|nr:DUF2490 domain-containing protein [Bacteroidota bacterium]